MSSGYRLSTLLRKKADPIWFRIMTHPFVVELYEGRLPLEKFKYYVKQDYNYLISVMKAFSLLASKTDYELARLSLEIAYSDATIEMDNYVKLLEKLGLTLEEVVSTEPSPTNTSYMSFLLSTCSLGSPLECLVSLLPCFWSYEEIALHYREKLASNPIDIYKEWGSVYLSKEYRGLVARLREAVDSLWNGESLEKLEYIFVTSSRYEYMFWDMAYRLEKWPV